jgi:hypothetical protein
MVTRSRVASVERVECMQESHGGRSRLADELVTFIHGYCKNVFPILVCHTAAPQREGTAPGGGTWLLIVRFVVGFAAASLPPA